MDKCREEFEAWFYKESVLHYEYDKSQVFVKFKEPDDTEDDYYLLAVRESWKAWKASRESMRAIKLPNAIKADNRLLGDNEYCSGYNQALRGCEKQITSAGYEVEE